MKAILTYPLPFNVWTHYAAFAQRFARTFREFPPEADYELVVTTHWGEPTDFVREMFYDIKTRFQPFYGDGCQIGAQQEVSLMNEGFIVGLTGHAYFHRSGWLRRLMEKREKFGPGLYGVCASQEGGKLHLRTSCYGVDSTYFNKFENPILSRDDCTKFECGEWCFSEWFEKTFQRAPLVVHWDSVNDLSEHVENGYRDGNQEQLLVWDRHTDLYASASESEKAQLQRLAFGLAREQPEA